jgi:hypothetical protein
MRNLIGLNASFNAAKVATWKIYGRMHIKFSLWNEERLPYRAEETSQNTITSK